MAQFSVHRNANPESSAAYPYLLDIQSDLIADLGTRVVAPLARATAMQGKAIKTLMPVFMIDGERFVMVTPQLAGVAKNSWERWLPNSRPSATRSFPRSIY
ncbi:MAG TPA: CcdB family protein [Candidatus Macondimonas sp.]|nr:CcdB family protein [Candidatus Macondimonas sp.]